MSSLSWLDYSEQERRQAMEVIDLFREEETRDELGLGTIRDAFADLFFPGTSTIQTRARYFLFVPWIYAQIEREGHSGPQATQRSRILHGRLRDALIAGGEEVGVIGYRAGLHVQRLPSSVYWNGLRKWGLLRFEGSEEEYQRRLAGFYRQKTGRVSGDAGETPDAIAANWDLHLPEVPEDFLSSSTFELTREEAEYLVDCVLTRARQSLLAHLLLKQRTIGDEAFAWELSDLDVGPGLADQLCHARNFSQVLHGAALLYNRILATQSANEELTEKYTDLLQLWWDGLSVRRAELEKWDRTAFWQLMRHEGARLSSPTRDFVDAWLSLALKSSSLEPVVASQELIRNREAWLKRGRARIGNQGAIKNWSGSSGAAQLDFRWNRPVRAIVNDIVNVL